MPEGSNIGEVQSAIDYLAGEGLGRSLADEGLLLEITHQGVVEVEKSLLNLKEPTEHFPQQVINYFQGVVGSVQTGNQNIAHVTQTNNASPDVTDLLKQLRHYIVDETPEKQQARY